MSTPDEPRPPRPSRWPHLPFWSAPIEAGADEQPFSGHDHAQAGDQRQQTPSGPEPGTAKPGLAGATVPGPEPAADTSAQVESAPPGDGSAAPLAQDTNPIDGHVLTDQLAAAVRRAQPAPPRSYLPEAARPVERQQLTEFVELARRLRVPSLKGKLAIGSGEWISSAAARSAAFVISTYLLVGARDADEMTDMLMRPLVVPDRQADGKEIGVGLPIAIARGRVLIDTSMSGQSAETLFRLVRVNERPELWSASSPGEPPEPTAADSAGVDRSAGTAAVIWGSAAAIPGAHPYLSIDVLMSYARKKAFAAVDDGGCANVEAAMRAARDLEVVVLLDQSMGGGLWIDVDRESGQPAAVLAVELRDTAQPDGIKVTALTGS